MTSPPLNELAYTFETLAIESFCQIIGPLFQSVDLDNDDGSVTNVRPEEVPLHLKVLRTIGDALVCCQEKGAVVVFEDLASNSRFKSVWQLDACDNLDKHGTERQESAHGGAESRVPCFEGRERDF